MLKINNIVEVNYSIEKETLQHLLENAKVVENYTRKRTLVDLLSHLIEEFEEEVEIGTFHDINDYIEYYIERCREI